MKKYVVSAVATAAFVMGASLTASAQTSGGQVTGGQATAETPVLPEETITGVPVHDLPTPPVNPIRFTLPIDVKVAKDASVTTNTPITDQVPSDYPKWAELIRQCLRDRPTLVRVVGDQSVPFVVNNAEGRVKLNANDKPVCPVQGA